MSLSCLTEDPECITVIPNHLVSINKERRLGSGTYSIVYEGLYLGSEVAVKKFDLHDKASAKAF